MSLSTTVMNCSHQTEQKPPILRLPSELLLKIVEILWNTAFNEGHRLSLLHCLSLVCKDIAAAFAKVSQRVVIIASEEFYNYYMRRLNNVDRSHPMNTSCTSLHFYVDSVLKAQFKLAPRPLTNPICISPLDMERQQDGLEYFCNGNQFFSKGLLPNLTHIFVNIRDILFEDIYHSLFPHFMPRTVQTLHINYTNTGYLHRQTPIRYPSIRHKLKRLTITGIFEGVRIARLWESLFEVEEFIVDGEVLPVGEDAPWGLDMNQALDMLESGCKGIGWNWLKCRPLSDDHYHAEWGFDDADVVGQGTGDFAGQPVLRRLKSLSHLNDSLRDARRPIKRNKSLTVLPLVDYPYGLRVWNIELLTDYSEYKFLTFEIEYDSENLEE